MRNEAVKCLVNESGDNEQNEEIMSLFASIIRDT